MQLDEAMKAASLNFPSDSRNPGFLLIVDEARVLLSTDHEDNVSGLNLFRLFRRALTDLARDSRLKKSLRVFAILSDTSSKISNFIPSVRQGFPSTRQNEFESCKLHDPFYLVANMDVLYRQGSTWREAFSKNSLFTLGRPMWCGAFLSERAPLTVVADLAERKILGGSTLQFIRQNNLFTAAQRMAVLNLRIPLNIVSVGFISENLPANHMRNVVAICPDRELVYSAYSAEPVLAYASSVLMKKEAQFSPFNILLELKNSLQFGIIDRGGIGEQLTAFLYILARDHCLQEAESKPSADSAEVPLTSVTELMNVLNPAYLTSLDAAKANKSVSDLARTNLDLILQGQVSFLQFIDMTYTPSIEDLEDAFLRGIAFVCRPGQAGVDLIIPVLLPENTGFGNYRFECRKQANKNVWPDSRDCFKGTNGQRVFSKDGEIANSLTKVKKLTYGLSRTRISCLCVQVKNSYTNDASANTFTNPWSAGIFTDYQPRPSLSVKHVLWSHAEIKVTHDYADPYALLTVFHRLTVPGINEPISKEHMELLNLLQDLLNTTKNPLIQVPTLQDKIIATTLTPASYKFEENMFDNKRKRAPRVTSN
jgi:hypothetical protein